MKLKRFIELYFYSHKSDASKRKVATITGWTLIPFCYVHFTNLFSLFFYILKDHSELVDLGFVGSDSLNGTLLGLIVDSLNYKALTFAIENYSAIFLEGLIGLIWILIYLVGRKNLQLFASINSNKFNNIEKYLFLVVAVQLLNTYFSIQTIMFSIVWLVANYFALRPLSNIGISKESNKHGRLG